MAIQLGSTVSVPTGVCDSGKAIIRCVEGPNARFEKRTYWLIEQRNNKDHGYCFAASESEVESWQDNNEDSPPSDREIVQRTIKMMKDGA